MKRGTISFGMRPTTEPAHHGGPVRCQGQPNQGNGPSAVNLRPPAPLVHGVLTAERDYAALYRAVGPALWQAIYAYSGGQRDLADDAVAEAFARAIQYDRGIRRPSSWLYRTAFRIAAAEIRRRRLQTEIVGGAAVDSPPEVEEVLTAPPAESEPARGRLPVLPGGSAGARGRLRDGHLGRRGQGAPASGQEAAARAPGNGGDGGCLSDG